MRILSFGEVLWDIIDGKSHLGGAPLNFAAHSVQCGGEAAILSRLGDDKYGTDALSRINKLGLITDLIQADDTKPTGTVPVQLVDGQPDYFITPDVAFDYIDYQSARENLDGHGFDVLYYGTLAQRGVSGQALKAIHSNHSFKLKFYDVNLRKDCYHKEVIRLSMEHATVAKLNEDEVVEIGQMLFGDALDPVDFIKHLLSEFKKLDHVILTAGGEGCFIYKDQTLHHVKSDPVQVVDAIGAGDSFSASFMYTFFKTGDIMKAAEIGNKVGGFVASSSGAIPKYSEEIKGLLKSLD